MVLELLPSFQIMEVNGMAPGQTIFLYKQGVRPLPCLLNRINNHIWAKRRSILFTLPAVSWREGIKNRINVYFTFFLRGPHPSLCVTERSFHRQASLCSGSPGREPSTGRRLNDPNWFDLTSLHKSREGARGS